MTQRRPEGQLGWRADVFLFGGVLAPRLWTAEADHAPVRKNGEFLRGDGDELGVCSL
jgi:hypothetical protein